MTIYYGFEKMKENLRKLIELAEKLSKIMPNVYYFAREWTPVKLILLMHYVHLYYNIMKKQRKYSRIIYIDPLAGAGINKIETTGDIIAGSPIISVVFSEKSFHQYLFAEADERSRNALKKRLQSLPLTQFEVKIDCNELLDYVSSLLSKEDKPTHYLLFVDCEGIEIRWQSMEKILSFPGDLIFVFQTVEIWEQITRWKKHKSVTAFFGNEDWVNIKERDQLVALYKKNIESVHIRSSGKTRELIYSIPIRGKINGNTYYYDMIFAAEKTVRGSPWFSNFRNHAEKIAKWTGKEIKQALHILTGRSSQIDWFMPGDILDRYFGVG